jgi:hypothetical protein
MPLPITTSDFFIAMLPPRPCRLDPHRIAGHRVVRRFQAFAGLQVEVLLVDRRGHHDALADAADQAARQHGGVGIRVVVIDGEQARFVAAHAEHGHLAAVQQRAHAGIGHDAVERRRRRSIPYSVCRSRCIGSPRSSGNDGMGNARLRSSGVAGRIWPRSGMNTTLLVGPLSLLTKVRKRWRTAGSSTAFFHSHCVGVDHALHVALPARRRCPGCR